MALALAAALACTAAAAQGPAAAPAADLQALKSEVIELGAEIEAIEQALRFPARERLAIYIGAESTAPGGVDTVDIELDGAPLVRHRYDGSEWAALRSGGLQRLYIGRLAPGRHVLKAVLAGRPGEARLGSRSGTLVFDKGDAPSVVELLIDDLQGPPTTELRFRVIA